MTVTAHFTDHGHTVVVHAERRETAYGVGTHRWWECTCGRHVGSIAGNAAFAEKSAREHLDRHAPFDPDKFLAEFF